MDLRQLCDRHPFLVASHHQSRCSSTRISCQGIPSMLAYPGAFRVLPYCYPCLQNVLLPISSERTTALPLRYRRGSVTLSRIFTILRNRAREGL